MNIEEINERQMQVMRENLKLLREQRGWSVELSRRSQISPATLARAEAGGNFGVLSLLALCRLYHIRPHEMFHRIQPGP